MNREGGLAELATIIDYHSDWWRFPEEGPIRGFLGNGPLFIVGDQPSTSAWDLSHPNRRAFYDLLLRLDLSNAHLTDLYKKRGRSGALKMGLPADFDFHLRLFRDELDTLRPTRVIALGGDAYNLLRAHVPEIKPILGRMWHFAYAVRYGRIEEWEENTRVVLFGPTDTLCEDKKTAIMRNGIPKINDSEQTSGVTKHHSQRAVMRRLYMQYAGNVADIVAAYADAERNGGVIRNSNLSNLGPEDYAKALLNDGLRKGWLKR